MPRDSVIKIVRRRLLGLAMIALIVALIGLSIAIYNKAFTPVVLVNLKTDSTGNQLVAMSDVKVRGLIVGSVRKISSSGDGATIQLALEPSKVDLIPQNVSAELLPKTLFGERYVALIPPAAAEAPIKAGDTISQDHSKDAIELQQVLDDTLPLLQALRPAELSATLDALATALRGRGAELGQTLQTADTYIKAINPDAPQLVSDLSQLGKVALVYNQAAPELLSTLTNLQTTSATLVQNAANLQALLGAGISTSSELNSFLMANGSRLIDVSVQTKAASALLAEYAPVYNCLITGIVSVQGKLTQAFAGGTLNITVLVDQNRGKYTPSELPKNPVGLGPNCYGLPNPPIPFTAIPSLDDGTTQVGATTSGLSGTGVGGLSLASQSLTAQAGMGSAAENQMVDALIAGDFGTSPAKVPPIATILAAPLLRGTEVIAK
jgi:phospholipid/cholesterol/gamma-HCH transport system substrate-binding protein